MGRKRPLIKKSFKKRKSSGCNFKTSSKDNTRNLEARSNLAGKRNSTIESISSRLKESDVGITEFISQHAGFQGIIKQRYSDFHVNEIDSDGAIVRFTSADVPKTSEKGLSAEGSEYLKSTLPSDTYKQLERLLTSKDAGPVEIKVTGMTKLDRTSLHVALTKFGKGKIFSNTKDKEDQKYIIVSHRKSCKQTDKRSPWPPSRAGEYVHFVLYKENLDTTETVNEFANRLRVKPNLITYAGTKDRRAKTSQQMCIWKVEPSRLASISYNLRGVFTGNYTFKKQPLKLGDLKGNQFRIALRNVTGSEAQINEALTSLKENGFLNYFGLQRFGSSFDVPTHEIGKALLKGDWERAVNLVLKPREGEILQHVANARRIWWATKDPEKALAHIRGKTKSLEIQLLEGLQKYGSKDYLSALNCIPRNTRLLYLHAYQSLIWNKILSRRIKEFGLKPLIGDLILKENSEDSKKVSYITEENLSSVNITDIVIPLPGFDIEYPNNVVASWIHEMLEADGLSSSTLKQNVRQYSVGGAYRHIVVIPKNVNWRTFKYSDIEQPLLLSDLDIMRGLPELQEDKGGKYNALLLDFCLPSSAYATMALREILRADTSSEHQALLTVSNRSSTTSVADKLQNESISTEHTDKTSSEFINLNDPNINSDICSNNEVKCNPSGSNLSSSAKEESEHYAQSNLHLISEVCDSLPVLRQNSTKDRQAELENNSSMLVEPESLLPLGKTSNDSCPPPEKKLKMLGD